MKTSTPRRLVLIAALAVTTLVSGCGKDNPESLMASAQEYMGRNDAPAAIIQLKNALNVNPSLPKARLMLAQALLATGDVSGAETEFRKAQEMGAASDEVVPQLARVMLMSGQFGKITTEFADRKLASPEAQADLSTTVAIAWQRQGQEGKYRASMDEAIKAKADFAPALIQLARTTAQRGDLAGALAGLDKIPRDSSAAHEALKLKGDVLLYGKRDMNAAMAAYKEALGISPTYKDGQAAIVQLLLFEGKTDAAAEALQGLAKSTAGRPQTLYLQAMLAYAKDDLKRAQQYAQKLVSLTPENYRALELAGMTELRLGANVQAETYLAKALQLEPGLPLARRGLVTAYMRLGRLDKAVTALPADVERSDRDAGLLALAGQVYMLNGDVDRAQRYFARATRLDPNDPVKRTSLAISRLASGQGDAALGELESIAASDDGVVADMALITALLKERKVDQALTAIEALEKKRPTDAVPVFLRGRALLLKRDAAGARKAMERVLEIDPNYFPAVGVLAVLDNAEKRPDDARARLEAAIKRQPANLQAHLALVELRAANGADKAELLKLLQQAVDVAPTSPLPRLLVVEHHLRNGEPKDALTAAQQAVAALPDNVQLLDALGRTQSANGEHNQALATFNRIAALQPQSPLAHLRMASANLIAGNRSAAGQNLRKALEIEPNSLEAQQGLASLAMAEQKPGEALSISRTIQKQRPKAPAGYLMEGEIHAAGKSWDKAIEAYRAGLKQVPNSELALKLHGALLSAGKTGEAERWASEWMKTEPKDVGFSFYLGSRAIGNKDFPEALRRFEYVMTLQPNNAIALNNIAWLKGQLGQQGALPDAERANAMAPNQPALMDTWAQLLSSANQHERAIELQNKVVQMRPQDLIFKLNLAKIQIKAGNKGAARALLDELSAEGDKFTSQGEVSRLRQSL